MPQIVHFEIPADDVERARTFYENLFGWQAEQAPGMPYWFIKAGEGVGGGMMKRQEPRQQITNYVGVASVDEYAARVGELGGQVVVPKQAVMGFGYFAVCLDTEGNVFGLWQDDKNAR
jgi:predicted enzyme related to lactoylglutathione lyase